MKTITRATWPREDYFQFFSQFDDPFFGIVTTIDCTTAFAFAKENHLSFFACYLHCGLQAINQIDELKVRLVDGEIVQYDTVHVSTAIGRADHSFGYGFVPFNPDLSAFCAEVTAATICVNSTQGLCLENPDNCRSDVVHGSSLPWTHFTGLTHARKLGTGDTIPKLTFGKATLDNRKMTMPVQLTIHHGLADGYHAAQFFEQLQLALNRYATP